MTDAPVADPLQSTSALRQRWLPVALLIPILIVAAYLRVTRAVADGLTFDEQWHVELSTGRGSAHGDLARDVFVPAAPSVTSLRGAPPWYAVWANMRGAIHPPLYCLSLRLWQSIFGTTDLALKALSILCSLIAIAMLFDALRVGAGGEISIACWTALLFAVAPAQVYLGQLVRGYAMLQMWGCGLLDAVVRIEQRGTNRRRALALGLCAFGLALTHYFGIAAAGAIGLYLVLGLRERARRDAVVTLAISAAVYLTAWGPFAWRQRLTVSATADPWLAEAATDTASHLLLTLGRMLALPLRQLLTPPDWTLQWPLVVGGVLLLVPAVLWRRRPQVRVWLVWIGGTLLFVTALDLVRGTRQLLFTRYTALAAPAIFALVAIISHLARVSIVRHGLLLALVALALFFRADAYTREHEPEWGPLGQLIAANLTTEREQPLVFYSGAQVLWFRDLLYLGACRYADACFPRAVVSLTAPADSRLLDLIASRGGAWLISGPLDRPAEQLLPGARVVDQWALPDDSGRPWACVTHVSLPPREPTN